MKFYSHYFREIVDYSTKDLVDKESNVGGKSDILRYEVRVILTKLNLIERKGVDFTRPVEHLLHQIICGTQVNQKRYQQRL